MDDAELLHVYAEQGSDEAFEELVRRYIGLVHSSALRQTHRPQLAEDVTQAVFIVLAKKAHQLGKVTSLAGWLFRTTRLAGAEALRKELRRVRRENLTAKIAEEETPSETDAAWEQAAPLLDDALAKLSARDRDAVLLRFFQNKTLKEVGLCLDCTEEAARKIVARALEKLRGSLIRRGVVLPALTLASAISTHSVQAASGTLTSSVCVIGAGKGAGASGSVLELTGGIMKRVFMAKAKLTAVGILAGTILVAIVPRAWPQQAGSLDPSFAYALPGGGVDSVTFQPDGKILFAGALIDKAVDVMGQSWTLTSTGPQFFYSGFARLKDNGAVDTTFAESTGGTGTTKSIWEANGHAIALQSDGKIVIGGGWGQTNALKHANIARLTPEGLLDPTFNPGLGTDWTPERAGYTSIYTLVVQPDDKILVSGNFKMIAGIAATHFARLNADGTFDKSFHPPTGVFFNARIQRPLLPDGKIIVNGPPPNRISRLITDGSMDSSFQPLTNIDIAMAVGEDGTILGNLLPVRPWRLARFNPDGTQDPNFSATFSGPQTGNAVIAGAAMDRNSKIVVVGQFDLVNGIPRSDIARLNVDGSLDLSFDAGPRQDRAYAEAVFIQPDGKILVSGQYAITNGVGRGTYLIRLIGGEAFRFTSWGKTVGHALHLSVQSQVQRLIHLEMSSNLHDWVPVAGLTNSTSADGTSDSFLVNWADSAVRFYRAVLE